MVLLCLVCVSFQLGLESRHATRGASKQSVSQCWCWLVPESESGAVLSIPSIFNPSSSSFPGFLSLASPSVCVCRYSSCFTCLSHPLHSSFFVNKGRQYRWNLSIVYSTTFAVTQNRVPIDRSPIREKHEEKALRDNFSQQH